MLKELKHRVFVVDDEKIIASTLGLILRNRGFDAHSFADPIAALAAAQSNAPDLLLTDLFMPKMNGIELAARIRQDSPRCKVLFFSGSVHTDDLLAQVQGAGSDCVIVNKPVPPAILIDTINEALRAI